ncbi:MAG: ATP-binding cassette domain-containing protein, partial [Nitrospirota bacterium]
MSDFAVETREIRKCFGTLCAVDGISIEVPQGEFFGFLGPNGAGKSTLIRMLTTVLKPTSGQAWVGGHDIVKDPVEVRRAIGVVPQAMSSDLDLTGRENILLNGLLMGYSKRDMLER